MWTSTHAMMSHPHDLSQLSIMTARQRSAGYGQLLRLTRDLGLAAMPPGRCRDKLDLNLLTLFFWEQ
jgi:hypothetical protein